MPKIFDTPRMVRIIGEDMVDEVVMINQAHQIPGEEKGKQQIFDLTNINCDIVIETGPSYNTKRMETADNLTRIIQAVPAIGAVCSDILVRNLDFPGASELSDRLKAQIQQMMPGIINDKPKNGSVISETELRAIITDLQSIQQQSGMKDQQIQMMQQMIQKMDAALKDKTEERQVKMDTAVIRADAELQKAKLQLNHDAHGRIIDTALQLHQINNQPVAAEPAPNAENNPAQPAENGQGDL